MIEPIAEIEWIDSLSDDVYWHDKDIFVSPYEERIPTIKTIGFIVREEKDYLIIAQSISEKQYGGFLMIPRGAIVRIKKRKR
ncbi:MAG: hypothetical protein ABIL39_10685 [candidate division WOR-3 bacterium]